MTIPTLRNRLAALGWLLIECDGVLTIKRMGEPVHIVKVDGSPLTERDVRETLASLETKQQMEAVG